MSMVTEKNIIFKKEKKKVNQLETPVSIKLKIENTRKMRSKAIDQSSLLVVSPEAPIAHCPALSVIEKGSK